MLGGYFSHRSPTSAGAAGAKGANGANAAGPKDCQPTLQCKKNGDIVALVNERPQPRVLEQQEAKQNLKTAMSKLSIPLKSSMSHGTFEIFQDACKQLEAQKKTAALSDILKLGKKITHNKKTSYSAEFLKKREKDNDKLTSVLKKANSRLTTLQKQKKPLQVK